MLVFFKNLLLKNRLARKFETCNEAFSCSVDSSSLNITILGTMWGHNGVEFYKTYF